MNFMQVCSDSEQPTCISIVRSREVPFTRDEILRTTPIPDVPEEEPSLTNRANEIPSSSRMFRNLCTNISNYAFNESYLIVGLLRKEFILVNLFIKYNITSSTTTKLYSRNVVLLNMIWNGASSTSHQSCTPQ